jgi:general secretion pathway protein D
MSIHTPPHPLKSTPLAIHRIAARARCASATSLFLATSIALAQAPAGAPSAAPASSGAASASGGITRESGGAVTLNFVNAEIAEVARTMGVLTKRNIVVDPRVKGQMNLVSDSPMSPARAYNQFLAAIRLQGFTVVDSDGISKVVPEADAKLQGGTVNAGAVPNAGRNGGNQILTQIFRLNYENANNLVPVLRPLISPNNTINVNPGNNSLIITDYADNLQRIAKIVSALDVSNATDLEIIPLRHSVASDLVPVLQRLLDSGGGAAAPGGDASFRTTLIAEPRSNAVIVRAANPARINLVKSLVDRLDQAPVRGPNGDAGNIYVVHLKHSDAVRLATTLRAAIAAGNVGAVGGGGGGVSAPPPAAPGAPGANAATAPTQGAAPPSVGGQIQADPASNSLIITASEPQYRQIRAVIERLDQRRAQVFVESLIAQVNSSKAAEFGIQWLSPVGRDGNRNVGALGTNFTTNGQGILGIAAGNATNAAAALAGSIGLNAGLATRVGDRYVLSALARWLEENNAGNVISTPNLLTLDNEEAKIVIGQNVPFITGQFTNTGAGGSGGSANPFQTIERKDVGITLRIKPQISENGTVRLTIFQERSNVESARREGVADLITNKSSVESQVVVEDGGVIVIGGLTEDQYEGSSQKVPGLGDIPVLGRLFKSEDRSRNRRELMLFLRPIVVRDAAQTDALSLDRYELIRAGQKESQPERSSILRVNEAPVLPPQRPLGQLPVTPPPLGASDPSSLPRAPGSSLAPPPAAPQTPQAPAAPQAPSTQPVPQPAPPQPTPLQPAQ